MDDDCVSEDVVEPDGEGEEDGDGRDDVRMREDAADSLEESLSEPLAGVGGAGQASSLSTLRPSQHQPTVEEAESLRLGVHLQEDLRSLQGSSASSQIQGMSREASPEVESLVSSILTNDKVASKNNLNISFPQN